MDFKIDVIGVGFPKCGTSWLSNMMASHPEITMAEAKETFYFIRNKKLFRKDIIGFRRISSLAALKKQFREKDKIKAEFSTMYIFDKDALQEIYKHNPDVKIIVSMRPPWEFLYSAFQFDKNSNFGHLIAENFNEYLNHWSEKSIIKKEWADYDKYMKILFNTVPVEQIHMIFMEDIRDNNTEVLKNLWEFIGLKDTSFIPENIDKEINDTKEMRSPILQKLSKSILDFLQSFKWGEKILYKIMHRRGPIRKFLFLLLKKNKKNEKIDPQIELELKARYSKSIEELYKLTGRKEFLRWNNI